MKFSQISHAFLTWTNLNASVLIIASIAISGFGQTPDSVLATVNGRQISQAEVDAAIVSQLFALQQQIYALRKAALDNVITRAVLEAEAKKRRVSVDQLKKQLTSGEVAVNVDQVEAVFRENASAFASMSPDEARERLRLDLESQARMRTYRATLTALRNSAKIDLRLEEPRLPLHPGLLKAPFRGPREAAVTIVEFTDFQCPYCRDAQAVLKQVLGEYPNDVRLAFKHLPLNIHDRAFAAAQAAFCAAEQNRFWEYHDGLFKAKDLSNESLNSLAGSLGLNADKFKICWASEASRTAVLDDLQEARRFGINSTPTFVVNGKLMRGIIGPAEFKKLIEGELRTGRPRLGPTTSSQVSTQE